MIDKKKPLNSGYDLAFREILFNGIFSVFGRMLLQLHAPIYRFREL